MQELAVAALRWDTADAGELVDLLWPAKDTEIALVRTAGTRVVGFAFASLGGIPRDPAAPRRGHINLLAVDPRVWRRGHATALFEELERRLHAIGAAELLIGGATPRFAWPGIDVRYTAATCFAEARGYVPARDAVNMTVELDRAAQDGKLATEADEKRLAEHGITVRRLAESDRERIEPWLATWGGTWREEVLSTLSHPENSGSYVAVVRDGAPGAEYVGFAAYGVSRRDWFGPMGTGGERRKLGIGGVLLRRCLGDLHGKRYETAQIGWTGPVAFYARTVDAYVDRVFRMYRKDR
ncbi:MAG TPA: GNAT family N-acetyltransferase [Actinospica sp.]|nr:GNAT family N-acetyltransferase [Actinospica sp.]